MHNGKGDVFFFGHGGEGFHHLLGQLHLRVRDGDDLRGAAAGPGRVGRAGEGVGVVRLNDRIGVGDIDDGDLVCRFNGHVVAPFVISSIRT